MIGSGMPRDPDQADEGLGGLGLGHPREQPAEAELAEEAEQPDPAQRYPDMGALSLRALTARQFAQAMAATNPELSADMMRVTTTRQGWLDEVWICMDTRFRYRRCPAHQGGVRPNVAIRIWRGGR